MCGLARSGLALDHDYLIVAYGFEQLVAILIDGQRFARVGERLFGAGGGRHFLVDFDRVLATAIVLAGYLQRLDKGDLVLEQVLVLALLRGLVSLLGVARAELHERRARALLLPLALLEVGALLLDVLGILVRMLLVVLLVRRGHVVAVGLLQLIGLLVLLGNAQRLLLLLEAQALRVGERLLVAEHRLLVLDLQLELGKLLLLARLQVHLTRLDAQLGHHLLAVLLLEAQALGRLLHHLGTLRVHLALGVLVVAGAQALGELVALLDVLQAFGVAHLHLFCAHLDLGADLFVVVTA